MINPHAFSKACGLQDTISRKVNLGFDEILDTINYLAP
jgi:hypothetical protein